MSKALKWVLGVLGALIVIGLVIGAGMMWRSHAVWWNTGASIIGAPYAPGSLQEPTVPYGYQMHGRYHMRDWSRGMPMMGGQFFWGPYAHGPFGLGLMLIGGLLRLALPLALFALVAYVFYQMGKRAGTAPATGSPASPRPDLDARPARKVAGR